MTISFPPLVRRFLSEVTEKVNPSFRIRTKDKPDWIYRIVRAVVGIFNKDLDEHYITVISGTCWVPPSFAVRSARDQIETLAHETVHEYDRKRLTTPVFTLLYLFPQILGILALLAILAIWFGPGWLWCLGFILFLAPIPSPGRMWIELRGYQTNMMLAKYVGKWNTPEGLEWVAEYYSKQFTGSGYYFMWPFRKHVIKLLVNNTKFEQEGIGKIILDWHRANGFITP